MKTTIKLALAATLTALALPAFAETIRVGIATEPYPPFSVPDARGQYNGWEIDITQAICAEAKLECTFVATAWDGIIPSLKAEKIDVIAASLSITAERQKVIDFSNRYYQTGASLAVGLGQDIEPTPASLQGKKLGVQSGSIHQTYALKHLAGATIREYQTQDEANQDLFAGRLDATLADALVLETFLKSREGEACCFDAGLVEQDDAILGQGIGFGLRKGNPALKAKLNSAIDAIRANGQYLNISSGYFQFNIYGE